MTWTVSGVKILWMPKQGSSDNSFDAHTTLTCLPLRPLLSFRLGTDSKGDRASSSNGRTMVGSGGSGAQPTLPGFGVETSENLVQSGVYNTRLV
mmetsp:Transcript_66320/g.138251  ORF Transcript_66320/g.138251 Transcript_66320/m.138251 type:complete len:94 (+) Transcript_66320:1196-1477(+)